MSGVARGQFAAEAADPASTLIVSISNDLWQGDAAIELNSPDVLEISAGLA